MASPFKYPTFISQRISWSWNKNKYRRWLCKCLFANNFAISRRLYIREWGQQTRFDRYYSNQFLGTIWQVYTTNQLFTDLFSSPLFSRYISEPPIFNWVERTTREDNISLSIALKDNNTKSKCFQSESYCGQFKRNK